MKRRISVLLIVALFMSFSGCGSAPDADHPQLGALPTVYITLENSSSADTITKEDRLPATVWLAAGNRSVNRAAATVKGRGNSTWVLPKKPYQIRFEDKTDLLGMGAARKWILQANYLDKTNLRNYLIFEMARWLGMENVPDCQFVDLVLNGEPQGLYLLTEKIELAEHRIDEKEELGARLYELEVKARHPQTDCAACVDTAAGVHVTLKDPTPLTDQELAAMMDDTQTYLNGIEDKMAEGYESFAQVIDVDSFINWYILNEIAKNYDAVFWTSCYCYRSADGILHMGPVWDVDVCYGNQDVTYPNTVDNGLNPYNYRADKGAWYRLLFEDETFVQRLKDRWNSMMQDGVLEKALKEIDEMSATLADEASADRALWPYTDDIWAVRVRLPKDYDYDDEIDLLKTYLTRRVEWLCSQWGPQENYDDPAVRNSAVLTGDGEYEWDYDLSVPPNTPVESTAVTALVTDPPNDSLLSGTYAFEMEYKLEESFSAIPTDYLMAQVIGHDGQVLDQTPATYLSYLTAEKDVDGYATLRLICRMTNEDIATPLQLRLCSLNAGWIRVRAVRLVHIGN